MTDYRLPIIDYLVHERSIRFNALPCEKKIVGLDFKKTNRENNDVQGCDRA